MLRVFRFSCKGALRSRVKDPLPRVLARPGVRKPPPGEPRKMALTAISMAFITCRRLIWQLDIRAITAYSKDIAPDSGSSTPKAGESTGPEFSYSGRRR